MMTSVRQDRTDVATLRRPRPKDTAKPQTTQLELIERRRRPRKRFSEETRLRNLAHTRALKAMLAEIVRDQQAP